MSFSNFSTEAVGTLKKLISISTVDPPGNEKIAAEYISNILKKESIKNYVIDLGDNRANLIATISGDGNSNKKLVYSAHFDTISVDKKKWSKDPFEGIIENDKMYGRGTSDMKSGLVSMVYSAINIKRNKIKLNGDLVLAFSAAENSTCLGAKTLVEANELQNSSALLISEPSSLDIFIAQKGSVWLKVTAYGEYGHNAFSENRTGDRGNAIVRMAKYIEKINDIKFNVEKHEHLGSPTINVGKINGGNHPVIIPDNCEIVIDVRTIPGLRAEDVKNEFLKFSNENIEIEIIENKPPVSIDEKNSFVKTCVKSFKTRLHREPNITGVSYYTDGTILAPKLKIPMVIIGPGENGLSGAIDEYVEIQKFLDSIEIYTEIAKRYLS